MLEIKGGPATVSFGSENIELGEGVYSEEEINKLVKELQSKEDEKFSMWLVKFLKEDFTKDLVESERTYKTLEELRVSEMPKNILIQKLAQYSEDCIFSVKYDFNDRLYLLVEIKETDEDVVKRLYMEEKKAEQLKEQKRKNALIMLENISKEFNLKSLLSELKQRVSLES